MHTTKLCNDSLPMILNVNCKLKLIYSKKTYIFEILEYPIK